MLQSLFIKNFKSHKDFRLNLDPKLNILVGDNEAGKSTILEAINLALTCRLNGRNLNQELSPYLFNRVAVGEYLSGLNAGKTSELPKIIIELYFEDRTELQRLKGTNNTRKENCPGVFVEISFDSSYAAEYSALIGNSKQEIKNVPVEYYSVKWMSFAFDSITSRSLPVCVSFIDATTIRLNSGTDHYLQVAINDSLEAKDRAALAVTYRSLKEKFATEQSIATINRRLAQYKSIISDRSLNVSVDVSQRANWETGLIPYLDNLPFHMSGRGEQSIMKTLLALERKASDSQIVLIEEPENHLSFSSMSQLLKKISTTWDGKQLILTTHSPYVLNKLGLDKLVLLYGDNHLSLTALDTETRDYFKKLPGFDTLRLILAKRSILVEGPSDELIIQRAYRDIHENRLPLEDGVDIICVRGLSFKRFLDIAKQLKNRTCIITDNDGDYDKKVSKKYEEYSTCSWISIKADTDNICKSIEHQLLKTNNRSSLNAIFGTAYATDDELLHWMVNNKTEYALRIFDADSKINYPKHIAESVQ